MKKCLKPYEQQNLIMNNLLSAFAAGRIIIVLVTRKKHVTCENLQIVSGNIIIW